MRTTLKDLIDKIKTPESKIALGLASAGFALSFAGMTIEDIIGGKKVINNLTQYQHYITPVTTAILSGMLGYFGGVNYIKNRNSELEIKEKQEAIINNPTLGFYYRKEDGTFLFANNTFARMFGYENPEELVKNCNMKDLYTSDELRYQMIGEFNEKKRLYNKRLELKRKNGSKFSLNCHEHINDEGIISGIMEKASDKTQNVIAICSYCDKIREVTGETTSWVKATDYIIRHQQEMTNPDIKYDFSHGICEECYKVALSEVKIRK